ncbi:MAG: sodium:alanine symporter family protein [Verrucomicrobiota bacterium]|nr:sodium:alanine symporter family protein [Verrucomicrobiota bacterium]
MIQTLELWIEKGANFVWGPWLIALLAGTHLYLTWRTGFVQRHLVHALKLSIAKDPGAPGDVSQFGALTTALAATIGTGNIYGVASAVLLGGPGAVLWMWLTGVFGIATKYSEALLSVKYRVTNEKGQMSGGPMYVLERALNARWAGILFALFTAIAAFGIGNMTQANAIADMIVAKKDIFPFLVDDSTLKFSVGIILAVLTAVVVIGGIRSISRFCTILVPFMAFFYVLGCLIILGFNWDKLGATISLIISSAFTGQAAIGGFVGAGIAEAMRYGIARGLFSNESGLGSAPIVAAAARTTDPVRQALVSSTGTFWDTVVVCALTGLVIVSSGEWSGAGMTKAGLCDAAFHHLGIFGDLILVGGLLTFVFSTILGWAYYGEKAVEYLVGLKAIKFYRILWVLAVFIGCVWKSDAVWNFSDMMNGLMAIPNLIAMFLLSGVIASETRRYFSTRPV